MPRNAPQGPCDTTARRPDDGGAFFPGVVDVFTVVRTENQIRPHDGFAAEQIGRRSNHAVSADGRGDMLLAQPPHWVLPTAPCVVPVGEKWTDAMKERHWSAVNSRVEAANLCAGCPVLQECRDAALEEESGRGKFERFLIRGGLTPKGRWELDPTTSPSH